MIEPTKLYTISFRRDNQRSDKFNGLFMVPGDIDWRVLRSKISGENIPYNTKHEAIAEAGKELVWHLNNL